MKCPHCGNSGAYTGLLWVHCQNRDCKYFDAHYTAKVRDEESRNSDAFYDKVEKLILLRGELADDDSDS